MAEPIQFKPWHAAVFLGAVTAVSLAVSRKKVADAPPPPAKPARTPPAWCSPSSGAG